MDNSTHKTEQERLKFIKRFAEIVKNNPVLKDRYKIKFSDVGNHTHFFICDDNERYIDVIKVMSKREYDEYVVLVDEWSR